MTHDKVVSMATGDWQFGDNISSHNYVSICENVLDGSRGTSCCGISVSTWSVRSSSSCGIGGSEEREEVREKRKGGKKREGRKEGRKEGRREGGRKGGREGGRAQLAE